MAALMFFTFFCLWLPLTVAWAATFLGPTRRAIARAVLAPRHIPLRRARWSLAIAATAAFVLSGIVATNIPDEHTAATPAPPVVAAPTAPSVAAKPSAQAELDGEVTCTSKAAWDQIDWRLCCDWKSKSNALPSGCDEGGTTNNMKIIILDIGEPENNKCLVRPCDSGLAHVRAFLPSGPVELWTDEENISPDTPRMAAKHAATYMQQAAEARAAGQLDEAEIATKVAEAFKAGNTQDVEKLRTELDAIVKKEMDENEAKAAENAKPLDDMYSAKHLRGGYVACTSSELLDQFETAQANKDERGKEYLFRNGNCVVTGGGQDISVLDINGWLAAVAHVRVYLANGETIELYTPHENLAR